MVIVVVRDNVALVVGDMAAAGRQKDLSEGQG
jgi:hypothetical protein